MDEFTDVFTSLVAIPPRRALDHAITLELGARPINYRPYKYSPLQKHKIECRITEMLESGVINTSMSPFTSHVLLVKKKDSTWHFCGLPQTEYTDDEESIYRA